jgi:hypothetical protein
LCTQHLLEGKGSAAVRFSSTWTHEGVPADARRREREQVIVLVADADAPAEAQRGEACCWPMTPSTGASAALLSNSNCAGSQRR